MHHEGWGPRVGAVLAALVPSCGGEDTTARSDCGGCPPGLVCLNDRCVVAATDGGGSGGSAGSAASGGSAGFAASGVTGGTLGGDSGTCPAAQECGTACCTAAQVCEQGRRGAAAPCAGNDDCSGDRWCDAGRCRPYGSPPEKVNDPSCRTSISIDAIAPAVQCRWTEPPPGDAWPASYQVMATPVVVDFDLDDDPRTLEPSIVFSTCTGGAYVGPGVLRVVSGSDCAHQFTAADPADATMAPASVPVWADCERLTWPIRPTPPWRPPRWRWEI